MQIPLAWRTGMFIAVYPDLFRLKSRENDDRIREEKTMKTPLILAAAIMALGGLYVLLPLVIHTFQRYRNKRLRACPETGGPAEINIDAQRAAFSSAFGRPLLKIKNCTLWPKKKGCGEDCIK